VVRERLDTARELTRGLLRDPAFRSAIPADAQGKRRFLVALLDEPMSEVFRWIEEQGTPIVLSVRAAAGSISNIVISPVPHSDETPSEEAIAVHPDAPVGMFVAAVWQAGGSVIFHRAQESDLKLQLV
jgi:hypothetical protein